MKRSRLAVLAALFVVVGSLPSCVLAIGNRGSGCPHCEHCQDHYSDADTYGYILDFEVEDDQMQDG